MKTKQFIKSGKYSKYLCALLLAIALPLFSIAQTACSKYNKAMKDGQTAITQEKYDQALIEFQAAQLAARECKLSASLAQDATIGIKAAIKGIQQQKERAETEAKNARKANARAQRLLKQTQAAT